MESSYKTYARVVLLGLLVSVLPLKFETGLTAGFSFAYAKDGESGGGGRSGRDGGDDGGGDRGGR